MKITCLEVAQTRPLITGPNSTQLEGGRAVGSFSRFILSSFGPSMRYRVSQQIGTRWSIRCVGKLTRMLLTGTSYEYSHNQTDTRGLIPTSFVL